MKKTARSRQEGSELLKNETIIVTERGPIIKRSKKHIQWVLTIMCINVNEYILVRHLHFVIDFTRKISNHSDFQSFNHLEKKILAKRSHLPNIFLRI